MGKKKKKSIGKSEKPVSINLFFVFCLMVYPLTNIRADQSNEVVKEACVFSLGIPV